jgi:RNA polymerase sigma-70 factor, ECF subfamily
VPSAEDLPARVSGVLAVLFLVFNEGYLATGPDTDPIRHELSAEAIRLTRLVRALMPEDGEVAGLLALMLLTEARRTTRVSASGELVPLDEQDRAAWDAALVAEGHRLVRERLASGVAPGRYQILAAINAVHTSAREWRDTDWLQVVALYDQLVCFDPSPIIVLNGPSRSPRSTAQRWRWQPSTLSRTNWPVTTPITRPARSCCAGWGAVRSRALRTTEPSSSRATPPRPRT